MKKSISLCVAVLRLENIVFSYYYLRLTFSILFRSQKNQSTLSSFTESLSFHRCMRFEAIFNSYPNQTSRSSYKHQRFLPKVYSTTFKHFEGSNLSRMYRVYRKTFMRLI